jgi:ribonuclease E
MAKKMLIDATHAEETRVVVVDGNKVEEFDFESENKRQLAGNIYLAKVTRVEPSLQAAFVDYGGNRHGFLAFAEIHPDYYQIPVADREALLAEEAAMAAQEDEEEERPRRQRRSRSRGKPRAESAASGDAVETREVGDDIHGMEVVEPEGDVDMGEEEGSSPVERVHDTPVETPSRDEDEDEREDRDGPYRAMDDASDRDEEIESVAEEDVSEEISRPRKSKLRKYKIQEVIKVRQILLVQVVKEERGNKGAALTTYLSLAGRYCVLMPNTARGGGISRKITNVADRKKLKEIANEIDVPRGAGLIIRTAGSQRTKAEIKRDYEYLQRLWEQIRELTLKSIAPAKIYEEGDLIKRSIRDLYGKDIDEVLVEGEAGYRTAKDFMKMIMPSHAKNVKYYAEPMPLFARFQVESYLAGMFNPTVQLKSGGYIVIGITEALVSIDVNSGAPPRRAPSRKPRSRRTSRRPRRSRGNCGSATSRASSSSTSSTWRSGRTTPPSRSASRTSSRPTAPASRWAASRASGCSRCRASGSVRGCSRPRPSRARIATARGSSGRTTASASPSSARSRRRGCASGRARCW